MKTGVKVLFSIGLTCLLILLMMAITFGEETIWNCPQCERTGNKGNYCGTCGHPAPWIPAPQSYVPVLSEVYPGTDAHLRKSSDETFRVFSYTGPGKSFVPSGGYKPYKQRKITVYFEENDWVLADVQYQTAEERVVYLPKSNFDSIGNISVVSDLDYYVGVTTASITPSWGPDNRFNSVNSLSVDKGTEIKIFFQENGFVYAEYTCTKGTVRMWLPANNVDIQDAKVYYSEGPITPAGKSSFK